MSDYWTSLATEGYISMTAHFVDDQWNFHNSVLATRKVQQMKSVQSQMSLVLNLRALWCYAYSWIRDTNPSPFCLRRWEPLYEMQSKSVSSVTFNPMILSHTVQNRIQIHKITHYDYEPTTKRGHINHDYILFMLGEYYETDCEIVSPATIEDEIKLYLSEKIVNRNPTLLFGWRKIVKFTKKLCWPRNYFAFQRPWFPQSACFQLPEAQ